MFPFIHFVMTCRAFADWNVSNEKFHQNDSSEFPSWPKLRQFRIGELVLFPSPMVSHSALNDSVHLPCRELKLIIVEQIKVRWLSARSPKFRKPNFGRMQNLHKLFRHRQISPHNSQICVGSGIDIDCNNSPETLSKWSGAGPTTRSAMKSFTVTINLHNYDLINGTLGVD